MKRVLHIDELTLTPVNDFTYTFSSGESIGFRGEFGDVELGDPLIVSAVPNNDPGNDHAYSVENIQWDESFADVRVRIAEVDDVGGGEGRITAWKIRP